LVITIDQAVVVINYKSKNEAFGLHGLDSASERVAGDIVDSGRQGRIIGRMPAKPDLIIHYPTGEDGFTGSPGSPAGFREHVAYAVVYVRPETNKILYERAILAAIKRYGEVIYLANLNGELFFQDRILEEHYASQFRFAEDPLGQLRRYPEIASRFEEHFQAPVGTAGLIGSFEAVRKLGIGEEELFGTIVADADFLDCWGQTFKRIEGAIVVNPNLPSVVKRYTPESNVFVVAMRSHDARPDFFVELNRAIFDEITARAETPVMDGEKLDLLIWSERIRRTYHISANHLMAMLDMADFLYEDGGRRLEVQETPLGGWLVRQGCVSAEALHWLKRSQLVYLRKEERRSLEYLPLAAGGLTPDGICRLLKGNLERMR
jgi:hypothetical protein